MKNILVPTDYSPTAENALKYAVELARYSGAKITLMHAYHLPVPTADVPVMMISPQQLEEDNQKRIRELEKQIVRETKGKVSTESLVRTGFPVEVILDVLKEKNIDLVVMGITGGGKLSEKLIGSHTSSVIRQAHTPVLVIPKDARYREVKKIALAYNYHETANVAALEQFGEFAKLLQAKVLVLDIEKPVAVPVYADIVAGEALENSLKDIEHVMFFSEAKDVVDEINSFVGSHECDWVAMMPHKHSVLTRLFQESNTKRMAFHTHIPLLSIHD